MSISIEVSYCKIEALNYSVEVEQIIIAKELHKTINICITKSGIIKGIVLKGLNELLIILFTYIIQLSI